MKKKVWLPIVVLLLIVGFMWSKATLDSSHQPESAKAGSPRGTYTHESAFEGFDFACATWSADPYEEDGLRGIVISAPGEPEIDFNVTDTASDGYVDIVLQVGELSGSCHFQESDPYYVDCGSYFELRDAGTLCGSTISVATLLENIQPWIEGYQDDGPSVQTKFRILQQQQANCCSITGSNNDSNFLRCDCGDSNCCGACCSGLYPPHTRYQIQAPGKSTRTMRNMPLLMPNKTLSVL